MELKEKQLQFYLQKISNYLLINGGFLDNPGLYSGEMGLVLFFFRYADFTNNELYSEYGFDLIETVQNRINQETSLDYKQGLTGIGSAFEYLAQFGFIEADLDEILEEFDEWIFDLDKLPFLQIEELFGIGYYALWKMTGTSARKNTILKKFLPTLVRSLEERCRNFNSTYSTIRELKELIEHENLLCLNDLAPIPISLRHCHHCYPYGLERKTYERYIEQILKDDLFNNNTLDLGLQAGLAGFGMSLMTEYDSNDSWVYLLPADLIYLKDESLPV